MDLRRVRRGEWLALAASLLLLAALWTTWYDRPAGARSGWEAFSVVDALLGLVALSGIALAALTATRRSPALPLAAAVITAVLSGVALVLLIYRLLQPPGPNDGVSVQAGAVAGLAGVLGVLAGAWLSMRDETGAAEHAAAVPVRERPAPPAAA